MSLIYRPSKIDICIELIKYNNSMAFYLLRPHFDLEKYLLSYKNTVLFVFIKDDACLLSEIV